MKKIFSGMPLSPKLLVSLLTSLVCAVSLEAKVHETHFKESKNSSTSTHSKEKECRECDFVITAKDIGCEGVVLRKSGYYCLCEDVVFNPEPCKNAAIRICASDVTLDLRGRTLSQKSKCVLAVDGIVVDPGVTNITIKNGTVRDFSDVGIRVGALSATSTVPLVAELSISDIRAFNNALSDSIGDPNFIGAGIGGVVIFNAQDVKISNCNFNENFYAGLWSSNITKLTMENCHCDDNVSANFFEPYTQIVFGGAVAGISTDILITQCTFNRNSSSGEGFGFGLDFAFGTTSTTNAVIESCQFNDTSITISDSNVATALGGSSEVFGLFVTKAANVTVQNCEAHRTSFILNVPFTNTLPPVDQFLFTRVVGFNIQRTNNAKVINCSSSGNTSQNNSGVGVRTFTASFAIENRTTNLYMSNCQAYGNTNGYNEASAPSTANPSLLVAEGFDFSDSGNIVVQDCASNGHNQASANPADGQFSIAAGFIARSFTCGPCGTIVFRRCVAIENVDTGTLGGLAFGFSTREPQFAGTSLAPVSSPYIFESCIAESNTNLAGNLAGTGSGFDIFNLANSEIINCTANSNNIGINVSDFTLSGGTTFGSKDNIFRGNVVSANTAFGIQDLSFAKTNAYYANQAKNNGLTPATTNYRGTGVFPAATCNTAFCIAPGANLTPLLYWNLPQAPCATNTNCVTSTPLDNLSIVN